MHSLQTSWKLEASPISSATQSRIFLGSSRSSPSAEWTYTLYAWSHFFRHSRQGSSLDGRSSSASIVGAKVEKCCTTSIFDEVTSCELEVIYLHVICQQQMTAPCQQMGDSCQ
uniref:(northern house mosquito) hypothetical protein n=1 Tax=Culex pipiens TaxID=7175 RepID=A0A8D8HCL6_CULPI